MLIIVASPPSPDGALLCRLRRSPTASTREELSESKEEGADKWKNKSQDYENHLVIQRVPYLSPGSSVLVVFII